MLCNHMPFPARVAPSPASSIPKYLAFDFLTSNLIAYLIQNISKMWKNKAIYLKYII
jgi:hypothetical protein